MSQGHDNEDAPRSSRTRAHQPVDPYDADEVYQGEEGHLLDYVKVLHKRRWTVATVFVVVVVSAVIYAFTRTPIYEARARLLIEAGNPNVVQFQQVLEERSSYYLDDYYETQYELLRSASLIRRTLGELDLWSDPVFLGKVENEGFTVTGTIAEAIGTATSFASQAVRLVLPEPVPIDASQWEQDEDTLAQSRAIGTFLGSFSAEPVSGGRLVDLTYRSTHPRLATTVINAHADAYIDQTLEFRFTTSRDATDWLSEQLEEQRRVVEASEAALHQYRQQHDAISFEDRENIVVQRLGELSAAHTRAKTEAIAKEATFRQLEALSGDPDAIDALPAVISNAFIQQVRADVAGLQRQRAELGDNLGPRHPEMIRVQSAIEVADARLQIEIDKVVESMRNEFLAAQTQVQSLARELNGQKNEALAMNEMGIGYGVLVRDAESNREIYESLLQRAKETGVSAELRSSNIRVVDHAGIPAAPVSPKKGRMVLMAILAGLMGGIVLAFFFEYLDNRIKTPEELRSTLGLPSLGLIPVVPMKALTAGGPPLINNGVPAKFSEAFKTVRTSLLFSTAEKKRSFVITSTGPSEGKSVVVANLGIGLAQAKQRVLLIDGDMRRPALHNAFERDQEPGLSNLLVGDASAQDTIKKTAVPGLWLLTPGKAPPNPAELLGSETFTTFLNSLLEQFDWVLVDSPPVLAVTDAAVVAHAVSGIIFVVGADMTSRYAAKQALDQLEAANGWFVGGILNRVDLERNAYYYSQYYKRQYQQYYTQDPDLATSTASGRSTLHL